MENETVKVTEAVVATVSPKPGDVLFINLRGGHSVDSETCERVRAHIEKRLADQGLNVPVIVTGGLEGLDLTLVSTEQLERAGYVHIGAVA